jgi:hypothetical protein
MISFHLSGKAAEFCGCVCLYGLTDNEKCGSGWETNSFLFQWRKQTVLD